MERLAGRGRFGGVAWLSEQGAVDKYNTTTKVLQLAAREGAGHINMGTLGGS